MASKNAPYKSIDYKTKIPIGSKNFQEILEFYLFEDPSKTGNRCVPLDAYGWINSRRIGLLKQKLIKAASDDFENHYHPGKKSDLPNLYAGEINAKPIEEYCVFLKNDSGEIRSLFSAIRNALAHGEFDVREYTRERKKTRIYFFCNHDGYEKARLVLREETLLEWIRAIQAGYTPSKKKVRP